MSFTRRDILVGLLGTSILPACKRSTPRVDFAGEIIDASHSTLGHRIRGGFTPEPKRTRELPLLILGTGVSGLSCAWQLRQAGRTDFEMLELADRPGGTAFSGGRDGLEYPWGAHYLPAPRAAQPELVAFLEAVGIATGRDPAGEPRYDEVDLCGTPRERVFYRGLWYEGLYPRVGASRSDLEQLERFEAQMGRLVSTKGADGRRAFTLPTAECADDPALRRLDEISMAQWLEHEGYTSERLRWLVDYACRDDFGLLARATSAWAGLHYFCARVPSAGEDSAEYLTWPEGNGRLVEKLVTGVGPERIHCGELVASVRPHGDGRRAEVISWNEAGQTATRWIASKLVFALPSFTRKYLIQDFEGLKDHHPSYAPWLVANIHLRDRPSYNGFSEAWDNVIYGSKSLGYVISTHQSLRSRGRTVWTYYLPLADEPARSERAKLLSLSWKEAADAIVTELSACHLGFAEQVERIDIKKWGHGLVRPEVGSIWSSERTSAARPVGPIHFAHTDLSGMSLFEEAFFQGTRAAKEVLSGVSP